MKPENRNQIPSPISKVPSQNDTPQKVASERPNEDTSVLHESHRQRASDLSQIDPNKLSEQQRANFVTTIGDALEGLVRELKKRDPGPDGTIPFKTVMKVENSRPIGSKLND